MDINTLDTIPNPIIIYNSNWNICKANKAAIDAFGFDDIKELINKNIYALVNQEDHDKLKNIQSQIKEDNYAQVRISISHITKNELKPPVRYLSHFTRIANYTKGEPVSYMESAISLEEAAGYPGKISSYPENYKILSDNIPGIEMFLIDEDRYIYYKLGRESFNQGWHDDLNDGVDFLEYFTPEVISIVNPLLKIAFEHTPVSQEFSINSQYFSIRLIPLKMNDEGPFCVVILQNITDTKLAENKLKISKLEAEEANRAKDNFVAKMSHEIRTPLNAVIGFSEQLKDTRLTKEQTGYLEVINNSSRHLLALIDDILVLSKIESGNIELDETPFRITDIFQEIDQFLELRYKKKGLEFCIEKNTLNNSLLLGDVSKLKQILINLSTNAIKFTHKGHIYMRSALVGQSNDTKKIRFEVSDTGVGINPDKIKEIFKPFQQVNNSLDKNFSGCGLGLTISKDLVKSMGGELNVKSTPGDGSTFGFELKFKKISEKVFKESDHGIKNGKVDHRFLRILFVDDDPINILLGKIILKKLKIKTDFANSGKQALKYYKPGRYNIIFLDINMPELNGMDVARQIRGIENEKNSTPKTTIVAMTANAVSKYLKQYINAGMDSILLKPYSKNMLYHKILEFTQKEKNRIPPETLITSTGTKKDPSYELDQLLKITKEDRKFLMLMLNTFVENSENDLKKFETFLAKKDYEKIGDIAHKLFPSVEQLGITKAAELLKQIERRYLIKKGKQHDPALIRETMDELQTGINAIKRKISEMS